MIKRKLIAIVSIVFLFALAACNSGSESTNSSNSNTEQSGESKEKITLKLGTYFATTSSVWTAYAEPWMKRVEELTDGQVEFEAFPGEQLGKAHDMLQLTKDGVMDIGIFPTNYFQDNMPIGNMLIGLPNLSKTSAQGTAAINDLVKEKEEFLEIDYLRNGIMPIGLIISPTNQIWSKDQEIRVPEDIKGLKVRTPGGVSNEVFEHLGVVPVALPHSEVYEAIEKGIVDAYATYSQSLISNGTQELITNAAYVHIGAVIHAFHFNKNVWDNLPENVQDAILQAADEITANIGKVYAEAEAKFKEDFVANGGEIADLTPEEEKKWEEALADFTDKWLEKHDGDGYPYREILEKYKELLEKYEDL